MLRCIKHCSVYCKHAILLWCSHSLRDRLSRALPSFLLSCRMWLSSSKSRLSLQSQDGHSTDRGTGQQKARTKIDYVIDSTSDKICHTEMWYANATNWTVWITAAWNGAETPAEWPTCLIPGAQSSLARDQGTVSVSLFDLTLKITQNRSRQWPTYCTDIQLTASGSIAQPLYDG